jgi:hypothetical protein
VVTALRSQDKRAQLASRRPGITVAINMVAALLFLFWPTVPGLIIGRIITGFSIGMLIATATAYFSELRAAAAAVPGLGGAHGGGRRRPGVHPGDGTAARAPAALPAAADRGAGREPSHVLAASIATAAGFALFGLFTSLAPGFIADTLHDHSHALAGAASFGVFGAAAVAQIATSRTTLRRQLGIGMSL